MMHIPSSRLLTLLAFVVLSAPSYVCGQGVITYCYQPISGPDLKKEIYVVNADGTANHKVSAAEIGLNAPRWSPDASKIVSYGYPSTSTWSVYLMDADGANLTRLTATEGVWDYSPVWSPTGAKIIFTRFFPDLDMREEIWTMNADGSGQSWTGIEGRDASWSPDSTKLVYSSDRDGNLDIYARDVDGSNELRLTFWEGNDFYPAWSPDGERIAFSTNRDGNYEIYVMDADGANPQRLTVNSADDFSPDWSPDGTRLAFGSDLSSPATDHWEVYVMNNDGTGVNRITYAPSNATSINPSWHPDPMATSTREASWGTLKSLFRRKR